MTQSDREVVRSARRTASRSDWREDYHVPPTQTKPPAEALSRAEVNAAKKQRAFHSAKDYETSASQIGDVIPPAPSARRRASLMVASQVPQDEVEEMLKMLGIHPSQPDWDDRANEQPTPRRPKGM